MIINSCYQSCPFFETSMDGMQCGHPYFNNKEPYANMIITHDNSRNKIPEKCPLRKSKLTIEYKLS